MKTLLQLSNAVQKNPERKNELLENFQSNSAEVNDFIKSLRSVPEYMVPALLETFAIKHRENDPKTVGELMSGDRHIGSLFVLSEDRTDWTFVGVSTSGKPMCRPINSALVMELDPQKEIRYVF